MPPERPREERTGQRKKSPFEFKPVDLKPAGQPAWKEAPKIQLGAKEREALDRIAAKESHTLTTVDVRTVDALAKRLGGAEAVRHSEAREGARWAAEKFRAELRSKEPHIGPMVRLNIQNEAEKHMGWVLETLGAANYLEVRRHAEKFDFDLPLHSIFPLIFLRAYGEAILRLAENSSKALSGRLKAPKLTEVGMQPDVPTKELFKGALAQEAASARIRNVVGSSVTNMRLAIEHRILSQCEKDEWERDKHRVLNTRLMNGVNELMMEYLQEKTQLDQTQFEAISKVLAAKAKSYRKPGTGTSDVA